MNLNCNKWIAAYYPFEMIESKRSRTIMCLLFDKIICHLPVADFACGGGHGSVDYFSNDILVKAGVIELKEEILLDDIPQDISSGTYWGNDEEFDTFYKLQITAMSLKSSVKGANIPITDQIEWPVPASIAGLLDVKHFATFQASALAINSLKMALPSFNEIDDEEILEAREKLKENLLSFRLSMLQLAPIVRQGIADNISPNEIYNEAKYVVETIVFPSLQGLKIRLEKEKGRFWRKILLKGGMIVPTFLLNWTTKNALFAAFKAVEASNALACSLINREEAIEALKLQGGMGYLLSLDKHFPLKEERI